MGSGQRLERRVPVGWGHLLCVESWSLSPPQSLFSTSQTWTPPLFRSHPGRSLGPLCVLGLHLPPASSNAILLKTLKVHNFVEDRKTILFASQLHSIFIFRCVNTS